MMSCWVEAKHFSIVVIFMKFIAPNGAIADTSRLKDPTPSQLSSSSSLDSILPFYCPEPHHTILNTLRSPLFHFCGLPPMTYYTLPTLYPTVFVHSFNISKPLSLPLLYAVPSTPGDLSTGQKTFYLSVAHYMFTMFTIYIMWKTLKFVEFPFILTPHLTTVSESNGIKTHKPEDYYEGFRLSSTLRKREKKH